MDLPIFSKEDSIIISKAKNFISNIFKDDSSGHDTEHSLRVYKTSIELSSNIQKQNPNNKLNFLIIGLSALLHDVDDYKLQKNSSTKSNNALNFLSSLNIDKSIINSILEIINDISFKAGETKACSSLEGKIVQDADRLDAIGAIGIARAFAFGGSHKRKIYDSENVKKLYERNFKPIDFKDVSFEQYKNKKSDGVFHFYEKLLALEGFMNTDEGKKIAKKRTEFMKEYLKELYEEIIEKE